MAKSIEKAIADSINKNLKNPDDEVLAEDMMKCIRLSGYQGNAPAHGWTRLYLNAQFNEYIDVKDDQIYGTVDLGGANSPLVLLLLDPEAEIRHSVSTSGRMAAEFLGGEITQNHLGQNRPAGGAAAGQAPMVLGATNYCGSFGMACASFTGGCGSFGMACASFTGGCGSFGMACGSWAGC